jgi:hypothetical protein
MSSHFRRPAAFERADEHVGVHDVAEEFVERAQRAASCSARVIAALPSLTMIVLKFVIIASRAELSHTHW